MIKKDSTIISGQGGFSEAEKPFDAMNNIVANLLLNITRYSVTVCVPVYSRPLYAEGKETVLTAGHAAMDFFLFVVLASVKYSCHFYKTII